MTFTFRAGWGVGRPAPPDVAIGLALVVVVVVGAFRPDESVAYDLVNPQAWLAVLCVLATVPMCWRRTHPVAAFLVAAGVTFVIAAMSWETSLLPVVVLVGAYSLGAHAELRRSVGALTAGLLGVGALFLVEAPFFDTPLGLAFPAEMLLVWGLGRVVALRERAADHARAQLIRTERDAALRSERAVLAERLRVARDLHDSVSSSLSAIALQAASVERASPTQPGVLGAIESTNKVALEDLRRLLRALRLPPSSGDTSSAREGEEARLRESLSRTTGWASPEPDPPAMPIPADPSIRWERAVDLTIGLIVVALSLVGSLATDPSSTTTYAEPIEPVLASLAVAPGLAMIMRRTRPLTVLAVSFCALTTVSALQWQTGILPGVLLLALYAVGAWAPLSRGAAAVLVAAAAMATMAVADHNRFEEWVQWGSLAFVIPYLVGVFVGQRRQRTERALAAMLRAERDAARSAERAVAAERLAVARDLHDLVTHNLAAIAILAAGAGDADTNAHVLDRIHTASRRALADLRSMLGSLYDKDDEAHLAPAPGLQELADLTNQHATVHGPVRMSLDEHVADEAPSLRTTIFRIVQEALTNAGRHAPGAPVEVSVWRTGSGVSITVHNEPPPPGGAVDATGSGWGLVGMQERVELYGGTLVAGTTDEGGFEVTAELPRTAPA